MSDHDLSTRLRHELTSTEPLFNPAPGQWRQTAHNALRRRRRNATIAVSAAAAVAVLAVAVVPHLINNPTSPTPATGTIPAAAQEVLNTFDPTTFPTTIDNVVRNALGDTLPANVTGTIEPTQGGYRLPPADYAYTDSWQARYDVSATDRVTVTLQRSPATNEGAASGYCEDALATKQADRCTVDITNGVSITTVTKSRLTPRGFARLRAEDGPDTWWFTRNVYNRRDYGFGVSASESVKATSLTDADQKWATSEENLSRIAESSRLVYELPTTRGPLKCKNTTLLAPTSEDETAEIVCERDLNQ